MAVTNASLLASLLDHLVDGEAAEWSPAFACEHERGLWYLLMLQFAQRSQFIALQRVYATDPAFKTAHMQMIFGVVDLVPFQIHRFRHAQPMANHEQD